MMQVTLNIMLIPKFGMCGAVWASIIVLGIEAIALYLFSGRFFTIHYQFGRVFAYCGLAAGFYGISTFIDAGSLWIDCLLKLFLLAVFPFTAMIFRIISQEEREKFIRILAAKMLPSFLKQYSIKTT